MIWRRKNRRRGGGGHTGLYLSPEPRTEGTEGGDSSLRPSGGGISARCSALNTVYRVQFSVYSVYCTVCTVQCTHGEGWRGGGAVRSGAQSKQQQQWW